MQTKEVGYGLLVMAAVVIILAGVKTASVIVVPFLLALFLAIILSPLFLWFKSKKIPEWLALVLIIMMLFGLVGLLVMLVGTSVQDFSHNVPLYEEKLRNDFRAFLTTLESMGLEIPKEDILSIFATDSVMEYIAKTLKSLGSLLTNSFMIILTVLFMLMEISQFARKIENSNSDGLHSLIEVSRNVKQFILLKSLTSAATGLVVTLALLWLKIDYAVLWGVVAFLLNFIPNIGSILAAVPAVLIALVQYDLGTALMVTGVYLVVNIVIGSILEPRIMGQGLGISPLVVFLSLIFWGWLLGPVGMLLSVPLTIMVKIVLDTKDDTKWLASLLGN
ncbi:MAG: AI-2E family transporter [Sulfurovum sp.]|nr:AI-2E family transporter [Sulfurovum sp.]